MSTIPDHELPDELPEQFVGKKRMGMHLNYGRDGGAGLYRWLGADDREWPIQEQYDTRKPKPATAKKPAFEPPKTGVVIIDPSQPGGFYGEGAIARCSYCSRYSLDPKTLGEDRYQPVCECGQKHGWSGSFKKPGPDAKWSGASPVAADTQGDAKDAARLDWLTRHISGKALRESGVMWPAWSLDNARAAIDAAMAAAQADAKSAEGNQK